MSATHDPRDLLYSAISDARQTEWVWLFYNRQKTLSRKTVRVLNRLSPGVSTTRLLVNLYFLDCIPGAQSMIVTRDSQYFEAISFEEESELHIFQR